jgi:phosphate/sulfate permease
MKIRRLFRSLSAFFTQLSLAMLKAVVTSVVLGVVVVSVMQYMGVPVPSAHDLIGGLSRLAHVLS